MSIFQHLQEKSGVIQRYTLGSASGAGASLWLDLDVWVKVGALVATIVGIVLSIMSIYSKYLEIQQLRRDLKQKS